MTGPPAPTAGPDWRSLAGEPGWRRLLAAARRSLERTGGDLAGSISVSDPTEAERLVVIGVTGVYRPASAARLTVRLDSVDGYLTEAYGVGLTDVLRAAAPLRNRPGEARSEASARAAVLESARRSRHADAPWYEGWLDDLRRDGTLTRIVRSGLPFSEVLRVLDALPAADEPLPAFADRVLGDTKGLHDGFVRGLTLRALAAWLGVAAPAGAEQERELWESAGVIPDDLASQVLVLNLPARGDGLLGSWLSQAAQVGMPVRVTLYHLRREPLRLACDEIFVCENPAVLRAAAGTPSRPLICTEGVPSAAVHRLLRAAPDAVIRWRNDFDWTGVRLTGAALQRYPRCVPWGMSVADYQAHAGDGVPLQGVAPAAAGWDPHLVEAMRQTGQAVMEERLLKDLLHDLRGGHEA